MTNINAFNGLCATFLVKSGTEISKTMELLYFWILLYELVSYEKDFCIRISSNHRKKTVKYETIQIDYFVAYYPAL